MLQILRNASMVALVSLVVGILPLAAGIAYAVRPTERRLAMMRPISLAGIFAGLSGTLSGAIGVLRMIWMRETPVPLKIIAVGSAESLVSLFVAFACLTAAWLCVALGMRRHS